VAKQSPPATPSADATVVSDNSAATVAVIGTGIAMPAGASNPSISISASAAATLGPAPKSGRSVVMAVALGSLTGLVLFGLTALWLLHGR